MTHRARHSRTSQHSWSGVARTLTALVAASLGLALTAGLSAAEDAGSDSSYSIWSGDDVPDTPSDPDTRAVELGTTFTSDADGQVSALRYYKSDDNDGKHVGKLWNADGKLLASATFSAESSEGWQEATLSTPVTVAEGEQYTVSYNAPNGRYADDQWVFAQGRTVTTKDLTALDSVYTYDGGAPTENWRGSNYYVDVLFTPSTPGQTLPTSTEPGTTEPATSSSRAAATTAATPSTTTPAPTTTTAPPATTSSPPKTTTPPPTTPTQPKPSGDFPNASNTGVPSGTALSAYTGPCTITTPATVIDSKVVSCDRLLISAPGVVITRSKTQNIDSDSSGVSVTITDSEVDGGTAKAPAVGYSNITMARVNVHGARVSVLCGSNCVITDSWLHGQYMEPGSDWHVNGYVSNGGSNVVVRHNTIACDVKDNNNGGGCTGPAASFGDFSPLSNITYDGNLFVATPGGYCLAAGWNPSKPYGSNPVGIVVVNNVFERGAGGKCGYYGAATSFLRGASGSVWADNTYEDGATVTP